MQPLKLIDERDGTVHLVHEKASWSSITAGFSDTHIRFVLTRKPMAKLDDHIVESVNQLAIQHEIPIDYEVDKRYENESFKGFSLRLKEMNSDKQAGFAMY